MSYFLNQCKEVCCGCTACEQSCPVRAITLQCDEEGFEYPIIDKRLCIECGLCKRVCPVDNEKLFQSSSSVYGAYLKDENEREKSSSGGVFFAIASWILRQGGVVYGAIINSNNIVEHVGVEKEEDLSCLRGSKYVQSKLNDTFNNIKSNLKNDRWCYFVGTGCQVSGLYSFLGKRPQKLICSDLVCHGVPSQWLFNEHINYLKVKYKGRISDYHFRDNKRWDGCESFLVHKGKNVKKVVNPTYFKSPYLYSFMQGMTLRPSCYECRFARIQRTGDITLADFWGVEKFYPQIDDIRGVSLVLVNSPIGASIWNEVKDEFYSFESTIDECIKSNRNLTKRTNRHISREFIYSKIREFGYKKVAESDFRFEGLRSYLIKRRIKESKYLYLTFGFLWRGVKKITRLNK